MIDLISLSLKNFMSFGNNTTVIRLQRPGTTLILGEDLDNTSNGQGANGVGKTVLINALAYGIYGKPISNISLDNLVNNINKKGMEVTVTFEVNNSFFMVKRVRKEKSYAAGNYMRFYKKIGSTDFTDEDEITRDSISNTNKIIQNAIGIPYELFCRIVVFSATHMPFLDLPIRHPTQACQTRIIEELFDLTSLTEKSEILRQQIKDNEQRLEIKEATVFQLKREHERHRKQIVTAKQRVLSWEHEHDNQLDELKSKLKKIAGVNITTERKAHIKLQKIEDEHNRILLETKTIDTTLRRLDRELKKKQKELVHLKDDKCPYCLQQFPDANEKIVDIKNEINKKSNQIEELEKEHTCSKDDINNLLVAKRQVQKSITIQNIDELLEIKNQAASIKGRLKELEGAINPFIDPVNELINMELDPINDDTIKTLRKVIEHQQFLNKLLTKKDSFVRKALLNKNIPFLNTKLQLYLTELGLPHTVEFTHELTAKISQFGRMMDFGNLSNGQRARVNLALSLAFRDVLQMLHAQINVCVFDEVLDIGLDTVGVQSAARLLKRKAREEKLSLYIISHRDEIDNAFDHRMIVQLSDGFSFISEE